MATATRWAVHGSVRPRQLVLWGDVSPPDLDLERAAEALADVEVTLVRGRSDPAFGSRLVAGEAKRLASAEIRHAVVTYEGGHEIDRDTLAELAAGHLPFAGSASQEP